jgi:hypothetical protein
MARQDSKLNGWGLERNRRDLRPDSKSVCRSQFLHAHFYWVSLVDPMSRDSAVGIAASYGLDDRGVGVRVPVGSRIFSSPNRPDRL